jgi:hypothetical protein
MARKVVTVTKFTIYMTSYVVGHEDLETDEVEVVRSIRPDIDGYREPQGLRAEEELDFG